MKRPFFSLLIFILASAYTAGLYAQVRLPQPEMYVGAHGGMTGSMVMFSPSIQDQVPFLAFGVQAGGIWRYIAEKHFGLQVELNYTQRGWKEKNGYHRQTDYVELPMLTHLYIGNRTRGFLNLGPKIGCLVADRAYDTPAIEGEQYNELQNRFDYGICGGIGFQMRTQAGSYEFEARFNYSLGNIFHATKRDYFSTSNSMDFAICFNWLWQVK